MNHRLIISALILWTFASVVGCTDSPQIESYRIHKDRSGLEKLRQPQLTQTRAPATREKTRMAVATFVKPDATWFFKISGPADQVTQSEEQWKSFIKSVNFDGDEPSWELPEGWSAAGPKPMRHSTLIIGDSQPPLELAISSLRGDQDLLLNVNRWRGQIGLGPVASDALDGELEKLQSNGGEFLLFDTTGIGSGGMRPPFAGGNAPFAESAPFAGGNAFPAGGANTKSSKINFETPEGWTEGPASSIVHARLKKNVDSEEIQITVIEMPADANEWEPNVKRWANQVGMNDLSKEQLDARVSELTVDGIQGKLVDLVDLDSESPDATIAGMVKKNGSAWFLKLTGNKQLVAENRDQFEKFMGSLKFN